MFVHREHSFHATGAGSPLSQQHLSQIFRDIPLYEARRHPAASELQR
jgi:hypothetical protein